MKATHRLILRPDGMTAAWVHPLDRSTGNYPQYTDWLDVTDMSDVEFEALVTQLQRGA
ncbi:hypothetical protein [Burkholderia multivorans]|uniref:hypothetical protein n=1 Tax=Burkholderia multivorans TaxID=87883 RepID=UPI0021BE0D64|nr:hypothetical protein [Burkholderia multivorans]